jgi:hypothetical protein
MVVMIVALVELGCNGGTKTGSGGAGNAGGDGNGPGGTVGGGGSGFAGSSDGGAGAVAGAAGTGGAAGSGAAAGTSGGAGSSGAGAGGDAGGLPRFGQACAPTVRQGDPSCDVGLVCVSVGAEQGRNLCTHTCSTPDAPCADGPIGTTPTCGRIYQVPPTPSRVCEFYCHPAEPNCPPGTTCLTDFDGEFTCQPPLQ